MDAGVTKHLGQDERLLWQAQESARLQAARKKRNDRGLLLLGPALLIVSGHFAVRSYTHIVLYGDAPIQSTLTSALIFGGVAIQLALLFAFMIWLRFFRSAEERELLTLPSTYAATDRRVLVVSATGRFVEDIARGDIDGFEVGGKPGRNMLVVCHRDGDPKSLRLLLDDPRAARSALEKIYPEARP